MFWFLKMDKQTMKDNAPKMVFKTQYKLVCDFPI